MKYPQLPNPFEDMKRRRGLGPLPMGVSMWPPVPIAVTDKMLGQSPTKRKRGRPRKGEKSK